MLEATAYSEQWGYNHGVSSVFQNNLACWGFSITLDEQYGDILWFYYMLLKTIKS